MAATAVLVTAVAVTAVTAPPTHLFVDSNHRSILFFFHSRDGLSRSVM